MSFWANLFFLSGRSVSRPFSVSRDILYDPVLNRGSSAKLKLGPSQEYKNARKQLVQLEKQVQSNSMSSQSRKKAQTPKPKRSAIRER